MTLWLLLTACGPSSTAIDDSGPDTSDTAETARTDEAIARALIAGDRTDIPEALLEVAWSGGWPVATASGTFLFVATEAADLAGDHSDWARLPMTEGPTVWWAEVSVPDPQGSRYKLVFSGNDWQADTRARSFAYDDNGQISFVRPPTDAYRIDRWPELGGHGLRSRTVRAYVPPGTGPWATVYMHDGQNLFDPESIWGGWQLQSAVAGLSEPLLVIGIDNTEDRMDEYAHVADDIGGGSWYGGEAPTYAEYVQRDVRPRMEAVYGQPTKTAIVGSSMGGLVSLYVALAEPGAFDFAGSLSGTLGWGRFGASNTTVQELYAAAGHGSTVLFVDSGGTDGGDGCTDPDRDGFPEDDPNDSDNYCMNRAFADAMAAQGYTWNTDLFHWHEPDAPHNELAWSQRIGRVLTAFEAL